MQIELTLAELSGTTDTSELYSFSERAQQPSSSPRLADLAFSRLTIAIVGERLGLPAASEFDAAVLGFRKAGMTHRLPLALLARAAHQRRRAAAGEMGFIDGIRADLAEVEDVAGEGPCYPGEEMRLYLTDLALERARLALEVSSAYASPEAARAESQAQTAKAKALIADTGYHLRDGVLIDLERRVNIEITS